MITTNFQNYGLFCTAAAVITHFSWLASFSWMTLIAANMTYAFAHKPFNSQTGTSGSKLTSASSSHILGWGIPFAVVVTCVGFHTAKPARIKFQYGGQQGVCWISGVQANLISFGIPVAMSVSVNMVLFIWTIYSLSKQKRESRKLNQRTSAARAANHLHDTLLYMKVGYIFLFFLFNIVVLVL